ncbi:sensor histidine kinase [Wenzhouxiangella sp. EGI_FJ10305]|uniref:sensor histidine kinase n=1 Tax=Wenzhouxiangella sp. EGI_FJ10305 TaxID=3243768 RepID=UPI0035D8C8C8
MRARDIPNSDAPVRALRLVAFLLSFLFLTAPLSANELGPVFRTLSISEGLPDRRVEDIVQDTHGYIWIGTRGGLVRHEGDRMRLIPSDPEQPDPLPGSNIMSLMAHSDGTVWAAVEDRGAVQIGPDLGLQSHLETQERGGPLPAAQIWSMAEDCDGRVWMAFMRGGVAVYDPATEAVQTLPQSGEAGLNPEGFQVHFEVDSSCRIWLVQTSQVSYYEPAKKRFIPIRKPGEGRFAMKLAEVGGRIYFNEGGALYDLGPVENAPNAEPVRIAAIQAMITDIADDPHSDEIIVGTTIGLHRKSPGVDGPLRVVRNVPGMADGLPSNSIDGVMFDREGALWLTTTRSGAAYLPPGSAAFGRYQPLLGLDDQAAMNVELVVSLYWDEEAGGYWIGGLRGELEFLPVDTPEGSAPKPPDKALQAIPRSAVLDVLREDQTMYVTMQTGVIRVDLAEDGAFDVLMRREELESGNFWLTRRKDDDHLWIGTRDVGLFELDERTGKRVHFHPEGRGRNRLPESDVKDLIQGPQGGWWLIETEGVYRWDEARGFEGQPISFKPPLASAAWRGDELWLATNDSIQAWRHDETGFEKTHEASLARRMPPGRMSNVIPDHQGHFWLLRTSGLTVYRPAEGSLRHLGRKDGLAPVEFGERAAIRLPDGKLAFGGRGGIVTVDPERMSRVTVAPNVHVTGLQAGDRTVELSPGDRDAIELEHHQNDLFIDFLATTYLAPERTRYRVRLEGWDSDWIELSGQTRHNYSSLPPGGYRFRVQAAAPDGPWNETGDELPVIIRQPPWLSGWAMAAYFLLAVTATGAGFRGYRRANQRRREVQEARQKRALAEEQRQIITRLNRSLEPLPLAETIAREIALVTGGRRAWLGYVDEHLPRELTCSDPDAEPLTREQWRQRLQQANGVTDLALNLRVAEREVARVLVEGAEPDFSGEGSERLRLLEEMAGQALHNALLLQRVRMLAERAEQASKAKSEFLATMSHEIRTPLHGVLGMVELLHETETEPGQQDILNTLRQSGLQLQRIIDDVLDISRIEAGRMSLNPQPFDLAAMLEQVVDLHAPNAARKSLDLRLRMVADLPLAANGDSDRISQVLGNLLNNAVKFTESGGIELSAAVGDDGQLVLVVSDSGPGISDHDRERLFEPFTQLDASITRSYSGSGLGLAICRRLVDAMDGSLDLIDACHGGSRFRVRLPVLETPGEVSADRFSNLLSGQSVAARVSAPTLRVLRGLGRRWGIHVVDASADPQPCSVLLVDPQTLDETDADRLDQWRRRAETLVWLQSPFSSRSGPAPLLPDGAHFLRWPLVESRFIGLLFDLRIGTADGHDVSE